MRLIDADKLEIKEVVRINLCGVQECFSLFSYKKSEIDEAPTVKAIPIEWLKKKYGWLTMTGEIIKDWEKENGRSE